MKPNSRQCLFCGLLDSRTPGEIADRHLEPVCVKCDTPLWSQSDGSTVTVDIAHQRETVAQALGKFKEALSRSWQRSHAEHLRLIVGGGLIRDAVLGELFFLNSKGIVLAFEEENRGAVLVRLRWPLL
ncbi:hypothetical protein [Pseudohongiella sp.]|uniref:hypothetical protein n=1 Tax=Pseudohongiella sp. TaxID=1979412 RepID=UPI0017DF00D3|nr:hypothetical protein [Pseudohongiella sp.]HDZ08183.1 hypothetical protein [Pseudohongiella sp.]HEA63151.1 hypothetical protein [Pseudohongiella sp.]